jgi:hypothetical protein
MTLRVSTASMRVITGIDVSRSLGSRFSCRSIEFSPTATMGSGRRQRLSLLEAIIPSEVESRVKLYALVHSSIMSQPKVMLSGRLRRKASVVLQSQ